MELPQNRNFGIRLTSLKGAPLQQNAKQPRIRGIRAKKYLGKTTKAIPSQQWAKGARGLFSKKAIKSFAGSRAGGKKLLLHPSRRSVNQGTGKA